MHVNDCKRDFCILHHFASFLILFECVWIYLILVASCCIILHLFQGFLRRSVSIQFTLHIPTHPCAIYSISWWKLGRTCQECPPQRKRTPRTKEKAEVLPWDRMLHLGWHAWIGSLLASECSNTLPSKCKSQDVPVWHDRLQKSLQRYAKVCKGYPAVFAVRKAGR